MTGIWTKLGGGSRYYVKGLIEGKEVILYYDIAGAATGKARSTASSKRPWTVAVAGKHLRDYAGKVRIFGSEETARAAAAKVIKEAM
ncbi:hypothetical protein LAV_00138 [Sphingobium phage Lacusarx]|uniref:Uncharacterized protein n=1 Tax=Sphingobium phage Lacusarx TaxID=1980139 RepID=A0A1W6DX65_9CAUD|nr:hypothetical protein FDH44_gp165 [Sphingobium phage Lacusarx]ARK07513.1 hypothetical protein LAV_00138 [Sphingobium phage Lacusarx]